MSIVFPTAIMDCKRVIYLIFEEGIIGLFRSGEFVGSTLASLAG